MNSRSVPFFNYSEFYRREKEVTLPVIEAVLVAFPPPGASAIVISRTTS